MYVPKGTVDLRTIAAPSSPPSGQARLYVDSTTGVPMVRDSAGASQRLDNTVCLPFTIPGALVAAAGIYRMPVPVLGLVETVLAQVGTAPTGASILLDVHYNGTTIFTTQSNRVTIAASAQVSTIGTINAPSVSPASNGYLSIDLDQVGSSVAGSNLAGVIVIRRTG